MEVAPVNAVREPKVRRVRVPLNVDVKLPDNQRVFPLTAVTTVAEARPLALTDIPTATPALELT